MIPGAPTRREHERSRLLLFPEETVYKRQATGPARANKKGVPSVLPNTHSVERS